jgi:DNA invertase Pin-like site-specific DNA recombinase
MRTKEGLAAARASGRKLGRPKGVLGKSKLDGREDEIKRLLALGVSKASIAKITGVDRSTPYNFIRSRELGRVEQVFPIESTLALPPNAACPSQGTTLSS